MARLVVLCGMPACGKSTLIEKFIEANSDFEFVDIFDYIKKYKDKTGHVDPKNSLQAYQEMYSDIKKKDKNIILELGTNHSELNLTSLADLINKYSVRIIFCSIDKKICIDRIIQRALVDNKRIIHPQDLEEKFKRIFPQNHIELADRLNIDYFEMDMNQPMESRLEIIRNLTN
ncbi:MAG: AAA family ATPase [Candidatus Buchananbacteria bacterium]